MMRALRVGTIGVRYWGARAGHTWALLPEDDHFERLVSDLVGVLAGRHGDPSVVAPRPAPPSPSWLDRLARFIKPTRPQELVNPRRLEPTAALLDAARRDTNLDFASVEFGRSPGLPTALMFSSKGRALLWLWLHEDVHTSASELVQSASPDWSCTDQQLDWERLLPPRPRLSTELPRATLHRGDSASWTDGSRSLGFSAGLGVNPHEVYLPPESEWTASAPAWAATLRSAIVRDFEQLGVRVIEIRGAAVFEV